MFQYSLPLLEHTFHICELITLCYIEKWGRAVVEWLRVYATKRQVAGSIPDGVTGNFQ
jgi:hypothetical protein